jgi:hypothetical protein
MNKSIRSILFLTLLLTSCTKDYPKQLTRDLVKGGKWSISAFHIQEYNSNNGWEEGIVFDTLYLDPGHMEFLDEGGDFGPTYRKGNFKFQMQEIPFDWDAYSPPSSEDIPVMFFIFHKSWNGFIQNHEHKATLELWEEDRVKLRFDLGNMGTNNNHVIYTVLLTH